MKEITIYDSSFEALQEKADELDVDIREVIEQLVEEYIDEVEF